MKMRISMPSNRSVLFLLASVAIEETKKRMPGKFINRNSGDKRKKNE